VTSSTSGPTQRGPASGRQPGENRWWPALGTVVAIAVYAALPQTLLFAPRFVVPAVEALLLVALLITNPRRLDRETRVSRWSSIVLVVLVITTNLVALGLLIRELVEPRTGGGQLLVAAVQVWLTNVVGFALLYWEIDRGGPVRRARSERSELPPADWRFSQDEDDDAVREVAATSSARSDWRPRFVDYLYLSLTNSSAFSPTDTMPLTSRAKLLMGVEATAALFTSLLVIARAVGTLAGGGS
jgi:uncharacterized membrane protein